MRAKFENIRTKFQSLAQSGDEPVDGGEVTQRRVQVVLAVGRGFAGGWHHDEGAAFHVATSGGGRQALLQHLQNQSRLHPENVNKVFISNT